MYASVCWVPYANTQYEFLILHLSRPFHQKFIRWGAFICIIIVMHGSRIYLNWLYYFLLFAIQHPIIIYYYYYCLQTKITCRMYMYEYNFIYNNLIACMTFGYMYKMAVKWKSKWSRELIFFFLQLSKVLIRRFKNEILNLNYNV